MTNSLGHIPTISLSPHQSKLYHLRMFLHHKTGATTYADLRTIDGDECPTFQTSCLQMGLLDHDNKGKKKLGNGRAINYQIWPPTERSFLHNTTLLHASRSTGIPEHVEVQVSRGHYEKQTGDHHVHANNARKNRG